MSWLSKTAKKVEKNVSTIATKAGVGNDLKKAANIYGAGVSGGAVGAATGFLTGGFAGAVYGGATGFAVAGYGKYRGDSSSKYLSNAAGDALIVGTAGPLIFKPAGTALITSPGPVSGYGAKTLVKTSSGGLFGEFSTVGSSISNAIKDSVAYIGKGGVTQLAIDGAKKLFSNKIDPSLNPNPDYQQGNAVAPGTGFPSWLSNILPGKSSDPTAPGASTAGGANTPVTVSVSGPDSGAGSLLSSPLVLIVGALAVGSYFIFGHKGHFHHA